MDHEAEINAKGRAVIWMEDARMWRLASMRRPPENLSEAIRAGGGERPNHLMVRIVITEEVFKAIKATLLVGSVALSTEVTKGPRQIGWSATGSTSSPPCADPARACAR